MKNLLSAIVSSMILLSTVGGYATPLHSSVKTQSSQLLSLEPGTEELRFTGSDSAAPLLSSETYDGLVRIEAEIPLVRVYHHGPYHSLVIPEQTSLLKPGYPTVPTLLFRYVVPDNSTVTAVEVSNIQMAHIKNVKIAPFTPSDNAPSDVYREAEMVSQSLDQQYPRSLMEDQVFRHIAPQPLWTGNTVGTIVLYPFQYNSAREEGDFAYRITFSVYYESPGSFTNAWEKLAISSTQLAALDLSLHNLPTGERLKNAPDRVDCTRATEAVQFSMLGMSTYGRVHKRAVSIATTAEDLTAHRDLLNQGAEPEATKVEDWQDLKNYVLSTWQESPGIVIASGNPDILGNAASVAAFLNYPFVAVDGRQGFMPGARSVVQDLAESLNPEIILLAGTDEEHLQIAGDARFIALPTNQAVLDWYAAEKAVSGYNARLYLENEAETYAAAQVVNRDAVLRAKPHGAPAIAGHEYVVIYDGADDSGESYYQPAALLASYHSGVIVNGDGHSFWYLRDDVVKHYHNEYNTLYFALMGDGDDNVSSNGGADNGDDFDIPSRFLNYPGPTCKLGGPCPGDPPKLPTDLLYEDMNGEIPDDGLNVFTTWTPEVAVGRVIGPNVEATMRYVQLARAYYTGEIDSNARRNGEFWMNNGYAMLGQEFVNNEARVIDILGDSQSVESVHTYLGDEFTEDALLDAIDGSAEHTGLLLYLQNHGLPDRIWTGEMEGEVYNKLLYYEVPDTIEHKYPFLLLDACQTGYFAGNEDNLGNISTSLLKKSVGVWAFTTTVLFNKITDKSHATALFEASVPMLNPNSTSPEPSMGMATAWGRKNFKDSGLSTGEDLKTTEALYLFGDPKAFVHSKKADISVSALTVSNSNPQPGEQITITALGTISNDGQWSQVRGEFYFNGTHIGTAQTGEWQETGTFMLSLPYQIPSDLSPGQHTVTVRVADSDYWSNDFADGPNDVDINAFDSGDWALSDWSPGDNEASLTLFSTNPSISVSHTQLNFGTVEQGQSATQSFYVSNVGGGTLAWQAAEDPAVSWMSLYPSSGTSTGESDPVEVTVDTSGLSPGETKVGPIAITSNGGSAYVDVMFTVGGNQAPELRSDDLDPPDGNTGDNTVFTYSVEYRDKDNDPPLTKQIVIDGQAYTMSSGDTTYDDGADFTFQRTAQQLGVGNHTYHFYFTDGQGGSARLPASGEFIGPLVASGEPWMWVSEPDGVDDLVITTVDPNYTITWTATDPDSDPLSIDLYRSVVKETGSMTLIASDLPNTGSYTWDTSSVPEGSYYIYGVSDDGHGQSDDDWSAGLVVVSHSERPASTKTWLDVQQLTTGGSDPVIALGPNDAVHVVWTSGGLHYTGSHDGGLSWSTPRQLSSLPSIWEPAIDTDASGNVHIVWEALPESANREIYYEKLDSQGNTLIDDKRLTNATRHGFNPDIDVDPSGKIHVVWTDSRNTPPGGTIREEIYYKRSLDGGTTWSSDQSIANKGTSYCEYYYPVVDSDSSNVYVVFEDHDDEFVYFVKGTSSGGSWGSPSRIDQGGSVRGYAERPSIVVDADGLHVAFEKGSSSNAAYKKSTNGGSSWTDDRLITTSGGQLRPDISTSGDELYIVNQGDGAAGAFLESLDGGAIWSAPDQFIEGPYPKVDADAESVHVVWYTGSGVFYRRTTFPSQPPTVTVISPSSGGGSASSTYVIGWTGSDPDPGDTLTVDLYYDVDQDPSTKNVIALDLDNTGSYVWDITSVPAGAYYVHAIISDGAETASDCSDGTVTINHLPTIQVTEPDGVSDTAHAFYTIHWIGWDPDSDDPLSVDIYYDVDTDPATKTVLHTDPDNTGSYLWETSGLTEGVYYVYAEITDGVNPVVSDYSDGPLLISHPNVPPTLSDLPDQILWEDDQLQDALNLEDYASDFETPSADLDFAIVNTTNPNGGVTIDANNRIDIAPATDWHGSTSITVQVSDGEDASEEVFTVTVMAVNDLPWLDPVPDQLAGPGVAISIDLTSYEHDVEDTGTSLDWYVTGETNCTVSGEYSDDDVLVFTPDAGFSGDDYVTLHLRDSGEAEDTQQIKLTWLKPSAYLPLVMSNHPVGGYEDAVLSPAPAHSSERLRRIRDR